MAHTSRLPVAERPKGQLPRERHEDADTASDTADLPRQGPTQIWIVEGGGADLQAGMRRAPAVTADVELQWCATYADGKQAVKQLTDGGRNPHHLWKARDGASEKRGRAMWSCIGHEDCPVVLVLSRAAQGGWSICKNAAEHTEEPEGGARR